MKSILDMSKKKKYLLVEPHSDDILFSASKFIFESSNEGADVILMTLEGGNQKRVDEDIVLCDLFDMKYKNIGLDIEDTSYYEYYKKHKKFNGEDSLDVLYELYGTKFMKGLRDKLRKQVKKYKDKGYTVVTCLGVGHPMHYFMMRSLEDLADLFYRDFPHSYKRKAQEEVNRLLETEFKLKMEHFDEEEYEIKWETAKQVYKTQSSLLFFEKGYIDKKLPEQFYVKK